jgi:multiple sugar transport system substrate-binding protein
MVNSTGYMPGNEIAAKTPDLPGTFYARSPNYLTSIQQLPLLTEWASFPGDQARHAGTNECRRA